MTLADVLTCAKCHWTHMIVVVHYEHSGSGIIIKKVTWVCPRCSTDNAYLEE